MMSSTPIVDALELEELISDSDMSSWTSLMDLWEDTEALCNRMPLGYFKLCCTGCGFPQTIHVAEEI